MTNPLIVPTQPVVNTDNTQTADTKPHVPDIEMDEDEKLLRALRIDLPGTASAPLGDVAITVRDKFPDKSFFRVHPDVPIFHMLHHTAGIDKEYYLVMPNMVPALVAIKIDPVPYYLYQLLTEDGATVLMPVRVDADDEWTRSKRVILEEAKSKWLRASTDRANGRYKKFDAAENRYPDPVFPDRTTAKLIKLGFKDRDQVIDSIKHPIYVKWAGGNA
jgi:hypothetical protein